MIWHHTEFESPYNSRMKTHPNRSAGYLAAAFEVAGRLEFPHSQEVEVD
jgi:hypothetical protein